MQHPAYRTAAALLLTLGVTLGPGQTPQARPPGPPGALTKTALTVTPTSPRQLRWPIQLDASGTIVAWQEAIIGAETGGLRITALHADIGDRVRRGDLLAELSRDTVEADVRRYAAALASARTSLIQAQADAKRARLVKGSGAVSEQQIADYLAKEQTARADVQVAEAELAAKQVTLTQTRILAVDDGLVTSRSALLGQVVTIGSELFRLQRQGRLEWQAEVDAKQLERIRPGAAASVRLPSGTVLEGTVRLVAPTLSTTTSRANVLVALPAGATAGMFASGTIEAGEEDVLAVPESALVLRDGRGYLFLIGADDKVTRRAVTTGRHREGLVQILSGLDPQSRVVSAGGAFLSDGDAVTLEAAAP